MKSTPDRKMHIARVEAKEMVDHPAHYAGDIECKDVMIQQFGKDAYMWFCLLNSFKYQYRCNMKEDCKQDLQKSRWYLNEYLKLLDEDE